MFRTQHLPEELQDAGIDQIIQHVVGGGGVEGLVTFLRPSLSHSDDRVDGHCSTAFWLPKKEKGIGSWNCSHVISCALISGYVGRRWSQVGLFAQRSAFGLDEARGRMSRVGRKRALQVPLVHVVCRAQLHFRKHRIQPSCFRSFGRPRVSAWIAGVRRDSQDLSDSGWAKTIQKIIL